MKYKFESYQHKVVIDVLGIDKVTQGACRMRKEDQEWAIRKTAMEGGAGRGNGMDQEDSGGAAESDDSEVKGKEHF